MPSMRAFVAATQRRSGRTRSNSLSTIPPAEGDDDYLPELATIAASILYKSPLPSLEGRPVYVLNAAAFPDAFEVDYDSLLAYVLARLPGEEELIAGADYEVVFFAGGSLDNATAEKKQGPSTGWYIQAYHVLSRATRKKLQKLYIVHPRTWVRVLINIFGTIVSPKFRRKILHVNSLTQLALHVPLQNLLIPPSAYLQDRKLSPDIYDPYNTGRRAFGVKHPLPKNIDTRQTRLPRVLRESTSFILIDSNIKTEGLFRIPPHNILSSVIKEAYDRGQKFLVWKEQEAVYAPPDMDPVLLEEVRLEDAYGVHLAASLIKMWYRELRDPIFPESSYARLKAKYEDPYADISLEDLKDLILPGRDSPLFETAKETMTRHLLPLLSIVAAHGTWNKMNPENLAICFSMCLLCGSNQLEDGKMSSIIKRILQAAIESWPQLRAALDTDEATFLRELRPPADPREYEDPLEDAPTKRRPHKEDDEQVEGHRIHMNESDEGDAVSPEGVKPALPPRRSRAASWKKALTPLVPDVDLRSIPRPKIELPSLPKRKPAPHQDASSPESPPSPYKDEPISRESMSVQDPPRYSALYDRDGKSMQTDSPTTYAPADGFGPPRRSNFSFDGNEKESLKAATPPVEVLAKVGVPKRKAVSSGSPKSSPENTDAEITPANSRTTSQSETRNALERVLAQQAANNYAQRSGVRQSSGTSEAPTDVSNSAPAVVRRPSETEANAVFRKPSWPASANRQPNIQSLAKPVVPRRQSPTIPTIHSFDGSGGGLAAPHIPKPRAPSPGLLRRMSSMEQPDSGSVKSPTGSTANLSPREPGLSRLKSVEDLKRLYEERASTAHTLANVSIRRTSSNQ